MRFLFWSTFMRIVSKWDRKEVFSHGIESTSRVKAILPTELCFAENILDVIFGRGSVCISPWCHILSVDGSELSFNRRHLLKTRSVSKAKIWKQLMKCYWSLNGICHSSVTPANPKWHLLICDCHLPICKWHLLICKWQLPFLSDTCRSVSDICHSSSDTWQDWQVSVCSWQVSFSHWKVLLMDWQVSPSNWQMLLRHWQVSVCSKQVLLRDWQVLLCNWQVSQQLVGVTEGSACQCAVWGVALVTEVPLIDQHVPLCDGRCQCKVGRCC